eukprot:TRINITY_DN2795_c0_g1_i3.p2 TRINITY_DN2795_c0_g1~~TRINITY_DN2795_c0_g1_i3.p2  ORF type:complete len:566 (-),score=135.67 TRINITY_DN2795_c0_g1_i3:465-2162(-)
MIEDTNPPINGINHNPSNNHHTHNMMNHHIHNNIHNSNNMNNQDHPALLVSGIPQQGTPFPAMMAPPVLDEDDSEGSEGSSVLDPYSSPRLSSTRRGRASDGDLLQRSPSSFMKFHPIERSLSVPSIRDPEKRKKGSVTEQLAARTLSPPILNTPGAPPNPLFEGPKKRFRRTAAEIERVFRCEVQSCCKAYGSEGALKMHVKLKHPGHKLAHSTSPSPPSASSPSSSPALHPLSMHPTAPSQKISQPHMLGMQNRPKYSNLPVLVLSIGSWQKSSLFCGDLMARFGFVDRYFVWEIFTIGSVLTKIEICYDDVTGLAVEEMGDGTAILTVETRKIPGFFEGILEPHGPTMWTQKADFTNGQASTFKRHRLHLSKEALSLPLEILLQFEPNFRALLERGLSHSQEHQYFYNSTMPPPYPTDQRARSEQPYPGRSEPSLGAPTRGGQHMVQPLPLPNGMMHSGSMSPMNMGMVSITGALTHPQQAYYYPLPSPPMFTQQMIGNLPMQSLSLSPNTNINGPHSPHNNHNNNSNSNNGHNLPASLYSISPPTNNPVLEPASPTAVCEY